MTIRMPCPKCRSPLRVPAEFAGHAVRCRCGHVFQAPPMITPTRPRPAALPSPPAGGRYSPLNLVAPALFSAAAIPVVVGSGFVASVVLDLVRDPESTVLTLGCLAVWLTGGQVWFLVVMYCVWRHVIDWRRRAGPAPPVGSAGIAVGLLFVPLVNYWWMFRFMGVTADLNRLIEERDLDAPLAGPGMGQLYCGLLAVSTVSLNLLILDDSREWRAVLTLLNLLIVFLTQVALILFAHSLQASINAAGPFLDRIEQHHRTRPEAD